MRSWYEEVIIDFLYTYECATSKKISDALSIKHPIVIANLIKLKIDNVVESINQELLDGRIEKFWRLTDKTRDELDAELN